MVSITAPLTELYLSLYCDLYTDVAEMLRIPSKESQRDLISIRDRVEHEGLSFLTKALPQLGKALDKCLSKNEPMTVPSTFRCEKGRTTPVLYRYLFSLVITPDGLPAAEVNTDALMALRQLVYFLYKLEIPATKELKDKVLQEFVDVDAALDRPESVDQQWLEETAELIRDIFASFDHTDILPKHGPGAVATGERNHEKHVFKRIYASIERVYPFTEYYEYSLSAVADRWRLYEDLEALETGTAKVVLVPKDSRGPRIISCEPLEYQWIQQGLGNAFKAHLEKSHIAGGQVNFTDQTINQRLALEGSSTQQWVTLDMKEASDRVSLWLVQELFKHVPLLLEALLATRSTHTKLPSGQLVQMKKFAPMGSNLCFPVEAICFYALAVTAIIRERRLAQPRGSVRSLNRAVQKSVYVYGDDIIVRQKDYPVLLQLFPTVGLKFNDGKCCTAGFFRESCGVDAYKGVIVTPLRVKKVYSGRRTVNARTLVAYVEYSNSAYQRGYKRVAGQLAKLVEEKLGELPVTNRQQGFLALIRPVRTTQPGSQSKVRYNTEYQRWEIRGWALESPQVRVNPNVWSMVLRRLTTPSYLSDPGIFAAPRRSCLHRGWSMLS
jgi:hypothetical protein